LLTQGVVERVGPEGDVLAIGVSVDALEELRATTAAPNVYYLIGRADVLPLMDESVDAVLARSVLIGTHDKMEAAREVFRVLGSGGRISMSVDPDEGYLERVFTSAGFGEVRTDPAWSAVHLTAVKP
jgi:ubiquinone/menaquinone biosynthesis C-methylase UbiE